MVALTTRQVWDWALAKSKDSFTHLWANTVIGLSTGTEIFLMIMSYIDDDVRAEIVGLVGESNVHLATMLSIFLMIVTKMARDRKVIPFTDAVPHE